MKRENPQKLQSEQSVPLTRFEPNTTCIEASSVAARYPGNIQKDNISIHLEKLIMGKLYTGHGQVTTYFACCHFLTSSATTSFIGRTLLRDSEVKDQDDY
jgi:hypothetical protein